PVASLYLGVLAVMTFFGAIHSASPEGVMYLPWKLADAMQRSLAYQFAGAYAVLAVVVLALGLTKAAKEPPETDFGHPDRE
ncbi:MAG: hypothetical protein ACK42L_08960, partial [Thermoanaerobaculum sp.]